MTIAWADHGVRSRCDRDERHGLRAALFGIETTAEGLCHHRARLTPVEIDQLAQALLEEVRRVRALLEDRTDAPATIDLADAIAPVINLARASGQRVRSAVRPGIVVDGRRDSIAQVLVALLDNARRHAPGSPIELRVRASGDDVTLYVEDRGPGMPHQMHDQAFERGARGQCSNGTGLGLFIVRQLMIDQGASVTVHHRPGGGTSFQLRFPTAAPR